MCCMLVMLFSAAKKVKNSLRSDIITKLKRKGLPKEEFFATDHLYGSIEFCFGKHRFPLFSSKSHGASILPITTPLIPIFSCKQSCPRDLYDVFKAVLHHLDRVALCQAFKVLIVKEQQVVLESPPLVWMVVWMNPIDVLHFC